VNSLHLLSLTLVINLEFQILHGFSDKLKCMFKWDLSVIYIINFARGLRVGVDAKGSGKVPFFKIGMENANNRPWGRFA